jgi:hypothetical protein
MKKYYFLLGIKNITKYHDEVFKVVNKFKKIINAFVKYNILILYLK